MMTDRSPCLDMPYLQASQAQKHVTHNAALELLDAVVQLSVLSFDTTVPPSAPTAGDRYILGSGATGDWAGQSAGTIARWAPPAWLFVTPREGWQAWGQAETEMRVFQGSSWSATPAMTLGINSTADATNRLTVASDATLLTHDGNDHQLKINKANDTDTASLLFQSNWTGHAEMGLTGGTDWAIKVSADGTGWTEALTIDASTGLAGGAAVQANAMDQMPGRLMTVGAFGLGASGQGAVADLNTLLESGFYHAETGNTANMPAGAANQNAVIVGKANSNNGLQILANRSDNSLLWRLYEAGSWSDWYRLLDRETLVGNVSESSGVPTGALLEKGSNANGSYVKWADGTMVCHRVGMSTVSSGAASWTYPAAFAEAPAVSAQPLGTTACLTTVSNRTATSADIRSFDHAGSEAANPNVDLIATGRWFA